MNSSQEPNQSLFNQSSTSIQACIECMFACKHCASACLQEEHVHMMRECIKHCLTCVETCQLCTSLELRHSNLLNKPCSYVLMHVNYVQLSVVNTNMSIARFVQKHV